MCCLHLCGASFLTGVLFALAALGCIKPVDHPIQSQQESKASHDARMAWWRDARFGLFIHWGLYAIPAGEWKGNTDHGEWIRHTAQIPVEEYEKFLDQFNPAGFDAHEWVRVAKEAGMRYIVITSKHHDGFCLFDSKFTDFDVLSTPFKRDVLNELANACHQEGIKICWYHSIMDWHHPDYLPRRNWEERSAEGADLEPYTAYMKNQLHELLTRYGEIGVLWFDGEWESSWNHERGRALYEYVRRLQPGIIVNNRVDVGRKGMEGLSKSDKYAGDFGTPEQQIPPTGLPGVDWETCMTMNRHWGYNKHDQDWKSAEDLIRKLADIASKGGNFLLNVGPTAEGLFPQPCVERLKAIGRWMKVNGESIYGTSASSFKELEWGRCTAKPLGDKTNLYLHVFQWPAGGMLTVPKLDNEVIKAWLLADKERKSLPLSRKGCDLLVALPTEAPDPVDSVIVLQILGRPVVIEPPTIQAESPIFIEATEVRLSTDVSNAQIRYTLDGSLPALHSPLYGEPIRLTRSGTVTAQLFRDGKPVSETSKASFTRVELRAAAAVSKVEKGLRYEYFEGDWRKLPDFSQIEFAESGITGHITLDLRKRDEYFALRFTGLVKIPRDGIYRFTVDSDDGSRLFIGEQLVVDNDGLHSPTEISGEIALQAGLHPMTLAFFQRTGGILLDVSLSGPGMDKEELPSSLLFHE